MCGGVEARDAEKIWKVYFPNPKAAIPVLDLFTGEVAWVPWGRRKEQPGTGPQGGWARLESVEEGKWAKYQPQRALGLVQRFMEKDADRKSHWFDMQPGHALECLLLGEGGQRRVYVVTSSPPEQYAWIHDRWPLSAPLPVPPHPKSKPKTTL
jgi:putative SOS response-associated peptidase YedK